MHFARLTDLGSAAQIGGKVIVCVRRQPPIWARALLRLTDCVDAAVCYHRRATKSMVCNRYVGRCFEVDTLSGAQWLRLFRRFRHPRRPRFRLCHCGKACTCEQDDYLRLPNQSRWLFRKNSSVGDKNRLAQVELDVVKGLARKRAKLSQLSDAVSI